MIHVIHIRDADWAKPNHVYIGRMHPHVPQLASPLANPYKLQSEELRDSVRDAYRRWLWDRIKNRAGVQFYELDRLDHIHRECGELFLVCWCAPRVCHGDVIASALNSDWFKQEAT